MSYTLIRDLLIHSVGVSDCEAVAVQQGNYSSATRPGSDIGYETVGWIDVDKVSNNCRSLKVQYLLNLG